jgi:hypothetical protein
MFSNSVFLQNNLKNNIIKQKKSGSGRHGVIRTREIEIVFKGFKKNILKNIKKL